MKEILVGLLLPFLGTSLGAAAVFLPHGGNTARTNRALCGVAAGVMTAASVWSLLLPAIERSSSLGRWAFLPAAAGLLSGVALFLLLDRLLASASVKSERRSLLTLAVTVHNLPEGIAVGVLVAGFLQGLDVSSGAVLALSLGIAAQNIPEGAILSLPCRHNGKTRVRAFSVGVLSGLPEPIGASLALLTASLAAQTLPLLLAFAAGAMLYVVVTELIPSFGDDTACGAVFFTVGFIVMMALDVSLG